MNINFSNEELNLLKKILHNEVYNSNHAEQKQLLIKGEEYRRLFTILSKIEK